MATSRSGRDETRSDAPGARGPGSGEPQPADVGWARAASAGAASAGAASGRAEAEPASARGDDGHGGAAREPEATAGPAPHGARPQDGLNAFVRRHTAEVWHYLRVCGCDPHTADDLTQEVFLVAMRKGFRPYPERTARRYLRRTARYAYLQHRQTRARDRWDSDSEAWVDLVDAEWERRQSRDRLEAWLAALAACRRALVGRRGLAVSLFYGERLSRAEVASRLSMTENGVKTLLQRVRADLRACVERALA